MERSMEFVNFLSERRKDCDILWVSRSMDPLLPHKLPPEAKYSRKQAIEAVINDSRVRLAIVSLAAARGIVSADVEREARAMVNEMASKADLFTVRWIGILITKAVKRIFAGIYINQNVLFNLKKDMQISQVQYVYAPSHRSYLDFILLSYILFSYDMALPNIASGMDFYQMRIVGELLRKTGAFYMRRSFTNDLLYKNVFRAYVMSIVSHSDRAIEFFIEGTRSRSMKSIVPKYGLLSIILESLLEGEVPDIQFIPISISYERPLEELLFAYELLGIPKPKESTTGLLKSLSILAEPSAYSNVFFNIGELISAQQFLSVAQRKARVLSPYAKLPSSAVEDLAYCIIDSHKKNTVLTPFNIICLLFNERVQMFPNDPYNLDSLAEDYTWCKDIIRRLFDAIIHTSIEQENSSMNATKLEILEILKPHSDLVALDTHNTLRLKQRHDEPKNKKNTRVKGHTLSESTMHVAVSAVNIAIYVNPTLSSLVKPAIAVVAIGVNGTQPDIAFQRYHLLRTLLSMEFAMYLKTDESVIKSEWEEIIKCLLRENCIRIEDTIYISGENAKLFSLLYNVILPFIDAVYIACLVLFEWDECTLGNPTNQTFLVESQKRAENAFTQKQPWGQHPYSLSLDLYNTTLSYLLGKGIVLPYGKRDVYRADKIRLAQLLAQLDNLSLRRPPGSYNNLTLLPISSPLMTVQAKL